MSICLAWLNVYSPGSVFLNYPYIALLLRKYERSNLLILSASNRSCAGNIHRFYFFFAFGKGGSYSSVKFKTTTPGKKRLESFTIELPIIICLRGFSFSKFTAKILPMKENGG